MKNIEKIREDIIKVSLKLSKYKESNNKPTDWRVGKDIYDAELCQERDAFFKIMNIIDEEIKSNNTIINQIEKILKKIVQNSIY